MSERTGLTKAERETIILWDDADGTASVYTYDRKLICRLKKLAMRYPAVFVLESCNSPPVTYRIPKRCVRIQAPVSEKRRKELRQQAQKNFAKENANEAEEMGRDNPPGQSNFPESGENCRSAGGNQRKRGIA